VVLRGEWRQDGRVVALVEVLALGPPRVTVRKPERIAPADRERIADWLAEYLPRLTHDERYALLWT
jgi:hypothetical protein